MTTNTLFRSGLVAVFALTAACDGAPADEDADVIADGIEQDNGGLDMEDEDPEFGDPLLFSDEGLDDAETDITDVAADDVSLMAAADTAAVYDVVVMWGQADFNRDFEGLRDWSGEFRVNRGAIGVRRAIRFEGPTDAVVRDREDLQGVRFTSVTGPHHDGLRLVIVDPDPTNADRLELIYRDDDGEHRIDVEALRDAPESREVDDRGNRIVAAARRRRAANADPCDTGFMRGRWRQVARNYGVLRGRIADSDGNLTGHMRGVYGVRRDGSRVFFGKAIGLDGRFRGIYAGTYRNGAFAGRWLTRSGERGVLGGHYRESLPGRARGGFYLGRWAEKTCNSRIPRDLP